MKEVRDVSGYEGLYGVCKDGNVYNLRSGCLVEPQRGAYVTLSKDGKIRSWRIGDLVAREWVRNVAMLPYVRHRDGNIRNNQASNLEWSYDKEVVRRRVTRRVLMIDEMGDLVCKYNSITDASYATGLHKSTISRCCHGLMPYAGGFRWKFEK